MFKEKEVKGNVMKLACSLDDEDFLLCLKTYLNQDKEVEVAGLYNEHYLTDKLEFVLKTKKGKNPEKVLKRVIEEAKLDLESKKINLDK